MNAILTEQLYLAFPALYRGRTKPITESLMCFGFECDDGWYQVLYDFSQELTDYLLLRSELDVEVVQIKSKFDTLRIRLNYRDASIDEIIERACQRADFICEATGDIKSLSAPDQ